jgi:hypothetical protein
MAIGRRLLGALSALLMVHLAIVSTQIPCDPGPAHCATMPGTAGTATQPAGHAVPHNGHAPVDCCVSAASCGPTVFAPSQVTDQSLALRSDRPIGALTELPAGRRPAPEPPPPKR